MASVFWDSEALTVVNYLPKGHTVTVDFSRHKIKEKRRRKRLKNMLLHVDNV